MRKVVLWSLTLMGLLQPVVQAQVK